MPVVTAQARLRAAPRDRGTFGDGLFTSVEDFTLYDRCVTRGIVASVLRVIYGNGDETNIGLNGNGLRHSDTMKITERFKCVAADIIQYQVTAR